MSQKILIVINDAPYGTEKAYNALLHAIQLHKDHPGTEVRVFLMADSDGERIPAGTIRAHGDGYAVYLGSDLGVDYWTKRSREMRQILERLTGIIPQQVNVQAPIRVVANGFLREEEKQLAIHLLNLPFDPGSDSELLDRKAISRFSPVEGIVITVSGYEAESAHLLSAGGDLEIGRSSSGEIAVTVPTVVDHEVVIFENVRQI